ncbi:MAG: tetratricopeptide repeat protein [Thermoplasmata archaeon]
MPDLALNQPSLIGRDAELAKLRDALDNAISGKGSTVFIAGEAGIGKTRLLNEFKTYASENGARVLAGAAHSASGHPYLMFLRALAEATDEPIFEEQEQTSFAELFAVNDAGLLLAKVSSEGGGLDADIFAGMLSAVQDFIRDSFGGSVNGHTGLGRLEYGSMKILIEHGQHVFLTAVVNGQEHPDMRDALRRTVRNIETGSAEVLESGSGKISELEPVQRSVGELAGTSFLVKKDIENVNMDSERLKIADKILGVLTGLSENRPVLLVLEDMHWADVPSLFVLQYLARNIHGARVMMLGTARTEQSPQLAKALEAMKADSQIEEMTLRRMRTEEVFALIHSIYHPNDFPEQFLEQMFDTCAGNPFFVIEFLRQMLADSHMARADGGYTIMKGDYSLPTSVEDVVRMRLDALEPEAMALAEYASCAGRVFDTNMLNSLSFVSDTGKAFERLRSAGLLERQNGASEFSHALFQDSIYRGISPRWKAAYHKSIGEYYEGAYSDKIDDALYELARHFTLSGEHRKGYEYCLKAAEKAEQTFAFEQAASYLGMALDALPYLRGENLKAKTSVLEKLGDLETLLGRFDDAAASYANGMEGGDAETGARLHRKTGLVHHKRGRMDKAMEEFETAKALLGEEESIEAARVLVAIGLVQEGKGDFSEALETQKRAEAIYERCGASAKDLSLVVTRIGACHHQMGEFSEAMVQYERALELGRRSGDPQRVAAAMNNMGIIHAVRGDYDAALECSERSLEARKKAGDIYALGLVHNNIGVILADREDFEGAEMHYRKYLDIARKLGDEWGEGCALNNIGTMLTNKGDNDAAAGYQSRAVALLEKVGDRYTLAYCRVGLGHALLENGDIDGAEENFGKALDLAREVGNKELEGRVKRMMGDASSARADWALAEERYEEAMRLTRETGATRTVPEVMMAHGVMLKAKGDNARARKMLEEARELYAEMGLTKSAERAERHIGKL